MTMIFINEFEFYETENAVAAIPFGLEGATFGTTLDDAVAMAADWLAETVKMELLFGRTPEFQGFGHKPVHGGTVIAVSVDVDLKELDYLTPKQAAEYLGVSTARISQMCESGQLLSVKESGRRKILKDSAIARKAECPRAGRPRKAVTA